MIAIPLPLISTIASFVTKFATNLGPMLVKNASLLLDVANKSLPQIIKTVETVSTVLDIINPRESAEMLGAKAIKSDKAPENFDKHNDYIDYLRKEVSIDKSVLSTDSVDVVARQVVGTTVMVKGISEKLGFELPLSFIKVVSDSNIAATVVPELVKAYSTNGLNINDLEKYLNKTASIEQLDKHSEILLEAYQKAIPSMGVEQAEETVMDLELVKV
ncbi:MAG: hypothetical protein HAW67_06710 [Endozoicomonadaceae bacterium]|nr:hypothetical protein [Endozoicomonadaceae bacterium]